MTTQQDSSRQQDGITATGATGLSPEEERLAAQQQAGSAQAAGQVRQQEALADAEARRAQAGQLREQAQALMQEADRLESEADGRERDAREMGGPVVTDRDIAAEREEADQGRKERRPAKREDQEQ